MGGRNAAGLPRGLAGRPYKVKATVHMYVCMCLCMCVCVCVHDLGDLLGVGTR
jgi:hypothetical protein